MLSRDELANGRTFILKLWDAEGVPVQWVEPLQGAVAKRWFDIYQKSNWDALRAEANEVFHNRVSEQEAERIRRTTRCVYIHTQSVKANEIGAAGLPPDRTEPDWETDGGASTTLSVLPKCDRAVVREPESAITALLKL
jgi:hypothetical protein